mgnify:CR=1 FL=1
MNRYGTAWTAGLLALILSGCGEETPPLATPAERSAAPLLQTQREALEKAKGVEQTLNKHAEVVSQQADQQAQ